MKTHLLASLVLVLGATYVQTIPQTMTNPAVVNRESDISFQPGVSHPNLATSQTAASDQLVLNGGSPQAQSIMVPRTSQEQGVMQSTGNPPPANIIPDTDNQTVQQTQTRTTPSPDVATKTAINTTSPPVQVRSNDQVVGQASVDQSAVARTVSEANFAQGSVTTPPPQGMGQQTNKTPHTGEVGITVQQSAAQPNQNFVPGAEVQSVPNQVGQNTASVGQEQNGRIPYTPQADATIPNASAQYSSQQQLVRTNDGTINQLQNGQVTGQQVAVGAGAAAAGGAIIAGQGGQQVSQQSARSNQVLPLSRTTTGTQLASYMNNIRKSHGLPVVNYDPGMENITVSLYQDVLAGKLHTANITSIVKASLAQQGYRVGKCITVTTKGNTEQDVLNDWWNSPNIRSTVYQPEFNMMGGARVSNSWLVVLIQIAAATQTANVQTQRVNQAPVATQA